MGVHGGALLLGACRCTWVCVSARGPVIVCRCMLMPVVAFCFLMRVYEHESVYRCILMLHFTTFIYHIYCHN